jgi:hypothetical protein
MRNTKRCHQQTAVSGIDKPLKQSTHLSEVTGHDLNNGRSSNGVVVRDGGGVGLEDGVNLSRRTGVANGDSGEDLAVLDNNSREHGAVGEREGDVEGASGDGTALCEVERDGLALHDGAGDALAHAKGRESLNRESGVGSRARLDEGRCQGVDLVEVEGDVEGLGEGRGVEGATEEGIVAGLDGEDAAGSGNVGRVGDEGGGAEVGAHTDTLNDGGGGQEGVRGEVAKVVCASLDRCDTSSLEGGGQECDVGVLIHGDLLEVLVEVGSIVTRVGEVLGGVLLEDRTVEVGLEVLKSQCVVEDDTVDG